MMKTGWLQCLRIMICSVLRDGLGLAARLKARILAADLRADGLQIGLRGMNGAGLGNEGLKRFQRRTIP